MAVCLVRFVHFGFWWLLFCWGFLVFFSFKFCELEFGHIKINIVQINIFLQRIQSSQFSGFVDTVIYHFITFCYLRSDWFGFVRVFLYSWYFFFNIFSGRCIPEVQTPVLWTLILISFNLIDLYSISALIQVTGQYWNAFSDLLLYTSPSPQHPQCIIT